MMTRIRISSGSPYEVPTGFSRAVRVGDRITVAGTAPVASDGSTAWPGDIYRQTRHCIDIIKQAIEDAGGELEDVVRTRIMMTDVTRWEEAARAHGEYFSSIRPACTIVEISRLIDEEWLVEMEADCIVGNE